GFHQFRDSGHVPVGIGNLDVPEVGRQRRHRYMNIDAVSMPSEETATDEGVSQIVKARQPAARPWHPAQLATQVAKGPECLLISERASVIGQEETRRPRILDVAIAGPRVLFESLCGGGLKHHDAG